jgi:hypothetical protein
MKKTIVGDNMTDGLLNKIVLEQIPNSGYGIITGDIGSGKSVMGYAVLEAVGDDRKKTKYVYCPPASLANMLPKHINITYDLSDIPNNSIILADEAYLSFYSREFQKDANKFIDKLGGIARHKDMIFVFISQMLRRLDISIVASARFLIFKKPSLLQSKFDRPEIRSLTEKAYNEIKKVKDYHKCCYLISSDYDGIVKNSNGVPSWWNEDISKCYATDTDMVTGERVDKVEIKELNKVLLVHKV